MFCLFLACVCFHDTLWTFMSLVRVVTQLVHRLDHWGSQFWKKLPLFLLYLINPLNSSGLPSVQLYPRRKPGHQQPWQKSSVTSSALTHQELSIELLTLHGSSRSLPGLSQVSPRSPNQSLSVTGNELLPGNWRWKHLGVSWDSTIKIADFT